ncbi:Uncharacterised protein [Chromobacterium violaceum]|uniref:TMEM205-like domain-containing protein n=1 Tax=Chromobacterium violaceum TaxID=536 RepID=A0A3S4IB45_CHRVL|nr:Uncharacterised protein [Chromobacterium violaceum]
MDGLRAVAKTLWIGGLWVIGLIVAPVLFKSLDAATAGMVAGGCSRPSPGRAGVRVFLLVDQVWRNGVAGLKQGAFWLIVGMLVCTLINQFGVAPIIVTLKQQMNHAAEGLFGGGFATWHAISSLIYLVQSVLGLAYIWRSE